MNELLNSAVEAHGGLERWNKINAIKVSASITGGIWYVKGKVDFLKNVVLTIDTRKEHLTIDFPGQNKRAIFQPDRVVMETVEKAEGHLPGQHKEPHKGTDLLLRT